MTYKYLDVRRNLLKSHPKNPLQITRTFAEMKKAFKKWLWITIAFIIISIGLFVYLYWTNPQSPRYLFPLFALVIYLTLLNVYKEKIIDEKVQKAELEREKEVYSKYICEGKDILKKCGIDSLDKCKRLKEECSTRLNSHEKTFESMINRVCDMLIFAPLGIFISAILNGKSVSTLSNITITIIILATILVGIIKGWQFLSYYVEDYYKDRVLLDLLNEIEYQGEM